MDHHHFYAIFFFLGWTGSWFTRFIMDRMYERRHSSGLDKETEEFLRQRFQIIRNIASQTEEDPEEDDVCFGDPFCLAEQRQWREDHPNEEISDEEQRSMDLYASESSASGDSVDPIVSRTEDSPK